MTRVLVVLAAVVALLSAMTSPVVAVDPSPTGLPTATTTVDATYDEVPNLAATMVAGTTRLSAVERGVSDALGAPLASSRELSAPEALDDVVGLADDYIDVTAKGSRSRNIQTSVTRSSFENELLESGFRRTVLNAERNVVQFERGGVRYVVRDAARSTGGPAADFYPAGSGDIMLKIRLRP